MLDWLVVGGGPHGVHVALRLLEDGGVPRDSIRIVDDEERLLARWRRSTRNTGMQFLRSPSVHHIDVSSTSLSHFASRGGRRVGKPFTRPYARPALELFDLHCDDVIERNELHSLHVRGRARHLDLSEPSVRVGFEDPTGAGQDGELRARNVILAIGAPQEPAWPDWARRALDSDTEARGRIRHLFDPGFELEDAPGDTAIAVVGAGISGAQLALRLVQKGRRVILVSRHALRIHQFDSDPGWLGPKNMAAFARIQDPNERRAQIRAARHRGSMPRDVHLALRGAQNEGTLELIEGSEVSAARITEQGVALELEGKEVPVDRVVLATGFPFRRPGGGWLDEAIEAFDLPCADCGYPILDRELRWHRQLFVTGPLAELELGPVSRNLSGAQRAGERLAAVAIEARSAA